MGGIPFFVHFSFQVENGGVKLGVYYMPGSLPSDMLYTGKFRLQVESFDTRVSSLQKPLPGNRTRGWADFFSLGPMAGGWDEAAWAAKGLPTSGQLTIKLTVSDVPQAMVPDAARAPGQGHGRW
jgi:hypothetical protein